jgi:guanine deaminase
MVAGARTRIAGPEDACGRGSTAIRVGALLSAPADPGGPVDRQEGAAAPYTADDDPNPDCGHPAVPTPGAPPAAVRGRLLWFRDDPFLVGTDRAVRYEPDGLLVCRDGLITYSGPYTPEAAEGLPVTDHRDRVITPGFVDAHVHSVQIGMLASYGETLLNWLQRHVYPEELRYRSRDYAETGAELFVRDLLRNGTTTALAYTSVFAHSTEAVFARAAERGMRLAAGKVLMDRDAPVGLLDPDVGTAMAATRRLIERWHRPRGGRTVYAVSPRFALACSRDMLTAAGSLWRERPDLLMQTHIAENADEVLEVRKRFPECSGYLDVYRAHGLLGRGMVLGHGVHLTDRELALCRTTRSAVAHCPTSNLFLGSGLFRLRDAKLPARPVEVALGTDVGGGTSLSLLSTMNEAYKVAALDRHAVDGFRLFHLATRAGARALRMERQVGSLAAGHEADFVVLDPRATPAMAKRVEAGDGSIGDALFTLALLGDDRAVEATYVAGRAVHRRQQKKDDPNPPRIPRGVAWSRFDWASGTWEKTSPLRNLTHRTPAAEAYAGLLYCVYAHSDDMLRSVYYRRQDDGEGEWGPVATTQTFTTTAPALAPYHDLLYCVFADKNRMVRYLTHDDDPESRWSPPEHVRGAPETGHAPAATAFADRLHVVVHDDDGRLAWLARHSEDGWADLGHLPDPEVEIRGGASIAAYAGRLYAAVVPAGGGDVLWTAYDPEEVPRPGWWPYRTIPGSAGTHTVRICHYNGLLYATGAVAPRETWWARQGADLPVWTRPAPIPEIRPDGPETGVSITPYHGLLYAFLCRDGW